MKHRIIQYIDRDSDVAQVVARLQRDLAGIIPGIEAEKTSLQENPGGFRTITVTVDVSNREIDKLHYFYRAAVVPYYFRQSRDRWGECKSREYEAASDELKRAVGFTLYDEQGMKTSNVNSLLTFKTTKAFVQFLEDVEAVCFSDQGYFFPDSKHFNELVESKGREAAQRQVLAELHEQYRNRIPGREI